jgi:copper chaperone NosL
MRGWCGVTGLAAALGLVAGCQPVDRNSPPPLRFGQEACSQCRMIISDDRFAAALTTEAGDTAKFDDVGCLVKHEAGGFQASTAYWVRDLRADLWLDAREAMFVRSKTIASPMGFGLAAMRTQPAAGEFDGDSHPRTIRFHELPGLIAAGRDDGPTDAKP